MVVVESSLAGDQLTHMDNINHLGTTQATGMGHLHLAIGAIPCDNDGANLFASQCDPLRCLVCFFKGRNHFLSVPPAGRQGQGGEGGLYLTDSIRQLLKDLFKTDSVLAG